MVTIPEDKYLYIGSKENLDDSLNTFKEVFPELI